MCPERFASLWRELRPYLFDKPEVVLFYTFLEFTKVYPKPF